MGWLDVLGRVEKLLTLRNWNDDVAARERVASRALIFEGRSADI